MGRGADEVYRALADGHRRAIVAALCAGPQRAGELARLTRLAPNALSFHLRELRLAGLVSPRRDGRFLWYRLNWPVLSQWRAEVVREFGSGRESSQPRSPGSAPPDRPRPLPDGRGSERPSGSQTRSGVSGHPVKGVGQEAERSAGAVTEAPAGEPGDLPAELL